MKTLIRALLLASILVPIAGGMAQAQYLWTYVKDTKELIGSTGEEEGDTDFRATCKAGGHAEVGIGAETGIGDGNGEAVSVTLTSGTKTLKIDGKSRNSPNFQMTAGVELQTTVDGQHAIFQLLAESGAIKVSGQGKKATWPAAGRAKATASFVKACFGR